MAEIKKRTRKGKRDLYWEEAQSLFLAGKELEEIQGLLPVALLTLKRWHQEGQWEEKRRQVPVSPRWLGEALKGILREKTGKLMVKGELKTQIGRTHQDYHPDRPPVQPGMGHAGGGPGSDGPVQRFFTGLGDGPGGTETDFYRVQEFFRQLEEEL